MIRLPLAALAVLYASGCYQSHQIQEEEDSAPPALPRPDWCPTFVDVQSGTSHACGLTDSGEVLCGIGPTWAALDMGQRGSNSVDEHGFSRPGIDNAIQLIAGERHTCALLETGRVKCWGFNASGQLGDGTFGVTEWNIRPEPVEAVGVVDALELVGAGSTVFARREEGDHFWWGHDMRSGQSWESASRGFSQPTPSLLRGFEGAVRMFGAYRNWCGLFDDGTVACLGGNQDGQLARRTSGPGDREPAAMEEVVDISDVAIGTSHICLLESGIVRCFGSNERNAVGTSRPERPVTPDILADIGDVVALEAGLDQSCALRMGGDVLCWGDGFNGPGAIPKGLVTEDAVRISMSNFSLTVERNSGEIVVFGRRNLPCTAP